MEEDATTQELKKGLTKASVKDEKEVDEDDMAPLEEEWTAATILEAISDGFDSDQDCILSYRILCAFYLRTQEYESAADVAKNGLEAIKRLNAETRFHYKHGEEHLSVILGSSYIYYQAPKNFDTAMNLFNFVLKSNKENMTANIGKGLIYIGRGELQEANAILQGVYDKYPDNSQTLLELSWCKILLGEHVEGREGLMKCLNTVMGTDPLSKDLRAQIWWRYGSSFWDCRDQNEEYSSEAFNAFVKSLQENSNYAPAYTALGLFYQDLLGDSIRATKCFYKAFELDAGEIQSAFRLASEFANNSEWDLVEVVASRVVESERLRTVSGEEGSWPYRALGIVGLNHRDYAKAIKYFQSSLRISPKDSNTWLGLGEAYTMSGRYVAASKAFERASTLDPDNWVAQYQLAVARRDMLQYSEAVDSFNKVLEMQPGELCVKRALMETYLSFAKHNWQNEYYGDAVLNAVKCIEMVSSIAEKEQVTSIMWKTIGSACEIFLKVQGHLDSAPLDEIANLLEAGKRSGGISLDFDRDADTKSVLVKFAIASFELAFVTCQNSKVFQSVANFNLGVVNLKAYCVWSEYVKNKEEYLQEAISKFKRAIQLEQRNVEYWNAYGIAASFKNSKVAQHCFIRSLSFNYRQPKTWANLAAFYLMNGDADLSFEGYEKAQSIDPEFVNSWIGQAIIDSAAGNSKRSNTYFDHSFLISQGSDSLAKLLFGLSIFERSHAEKSKFKDTAQNLEAAILSLQKFLVLQPDSDLALGILSCLLEKENNLEEAIRYIEKRCEFLEKKYDEDEKQEDLIGFAQAKSQLSRVYLATGDYNSTIEQANIAIDLATTNPEDFRLSKCILSSTLAAGLGYYFLRDFDKSIDYFRQALEVSNEDQDVIVLLAQVLWAHGGQNEKEVGLEELYASVDTRGTSLKITLLLGAIGLVDDPDLVSAAEEELEELSSDTLELDVDNNVQEMLSIIKKSAGPWQRAAFFWPSNFNILDRISHDVGLQLAEAAFNSGDVGKLSSTKLSDEYTSKGTIEAAQRSVYIAPWNPVAWKHLQETIEAV